jgi:hypothetical protein
VVSLGASDQERVSALNVMLGGEFGGSSCWLLYSPLPVSRNTGRMVPAFTASNRSATFAVSEDQPDDRAAVRVKNLRAV